MISSAAAMIYIAHQLLFIFLNLHVAIIHIGLNKHH